MRVKYCGGGKSRLVPVTLARFSYQAGMLIATPLSHDKFKLDPCVYYVALQGGRTRVKCHMTFIACQRRARMRLFPLRACGIMFSSARALLSVSATGLSKPVQC